MKPLGNDRPMFEDMYGNRYDDYIFMGDHWLVIRENGEAIFVGNPGSDDYPTTNDPIGDAGGGWSDLG